MADLSPQAQAVFNAAHSPQTATSYYRYAAVAAAALREAVEQVLPACDHQLPPPGDSHTGHYVHGYKDCQENARRDLLAIAHELENHS